jgi:hypothetical protein
MLLPETWFGSCCIIYYFSEAFLSFLFWIWDLVYEHVFRMHKNKILLGLRSHNRLAQDITTTTKLVSRWVVAFLHLCYNMQSIRWMCHFECLLQIMLLFGS